MSSTSGDSDAEFPLFDQEEADLLHELLTNPTRLTTAHSTNNDCPDSELKPTASPIPDYNLEWLAGRLFSADHLNVILKDRILVERFARFLETYRPQHAFQLFRCLNARKAFAAIDHTVGLAPKLLNATANPFAIAVADGNFENQIGKAMDDLISDALPAFITEQLVNTVTECLVKTITGTITPLMQEMVLGLGEIFCITDPKIPDNPVVYASEEFLNLTQHNLEFVIGRNCRFLQGQKTSPITISRLIGALEKGTEICETLLNYRKDGTPFMNLLTVQPLMDNRGTVQYYIGCQIDVSNLIEGGRGLASFHKLLQEDQTESGQSTIYGNRSLQPLTDLATMLDNEEVHILKRRLNSSGTGQERDSQRWSVRVFPDKDDPYIPELWTLEPKEPERLPQVYQNYLLIRPAPSFRVTFTSGSLRIPGLFRSSFLDRIGGPDHVHEAVRSAMTRGVAITAKISWLTQTVPPQDRSGQMGKPRWIHCTPMFGVDGKIGVWMVVMVENESISGSINAHRKYENRRISRSNVRQKEGCGQLYAHYLRREVATSSTSDSSTSSDSARKTTHRDTWWKDLSFKTFGMPELYSCIGTE